VSAVSNRIKGFDFSEMRIFQTSVTGKKRLGGAHTPQKHFRTVLFEEE
jgi:hypothetical protein